MIIGLTGYAQSGKDTMANILVEKYGFTRIAFADKIRNFLYEINPMISGEPLQIRVDVEGWEKAKQHPEVRRLLQVTGVAARNQFDKDFWITQAVKPLQTYRRTLQHFVITDVRFKNEVDAIKRFVDVDTQIWRVTRAGTNAVNKHVSELELEDYPVDITFNNDGTIEDLAHALQIRMQGLL